MKLSKPMLIIKFIIAVPITIAILFWPAGTLDWPEAWTFLAVLFIFAILLTLYFLKHNPEMIKTRMEMKVPPKLWDRVIMLPFVIIMILLLIIPGLDMRYQWSSISICIEIIGMACFIMSLYLTFLVMKENSYLLKTVEIKKSQKTVSTGPYKYVRHPMYAATILMTFSIAIALGSYATLIPAALASILITIRAQLEDNTLKKGLKGYKQYSKKVRYRLIPFVW